jgi:hypothetical protein
MADEVSPVNATGIVTPEQAYMQFALGNPAIPKLYGNAFQVFLNPIDASVLLSVNGSATGIVHMSYPLAKALGSTLTELIMKYEAITKTTVPVATEIEALVKASVAQPLK